MMSQSPISSLKEHFEVLKDPRAQHRIEHLLIDIVMITICAVICGAESWPEIEEYGLAKQVWLETFLELPNGIPPMIPLSAYLLDCVPSKCKNALSIGFNQSIILYLGRA
jgi:hypothetical protein